MRTGELLEAARDVTDVEYLLAWVPKAVIEGSFFCAVTCQAEEGEARCVSRMQSTDASA